MATSAESSSSSSSASSSSSSSSSSSLSSTSYFSNLPTTFTEGVTHGPVPSSSSLFSNCPSSNLQAAAALTTKHVNTIDTVSLCPYHSCCSCSAHSHVPTSSSSPSSSSSSSSSTSSTFWYFAIGSMINHVSLKLRQLTPLESHPAVCQHFQLLFLGSGGMASIRECVGASFHGVLHRLNCADMNELDRIESGYCRMPVLVHTYDGRKQTAFVYKMDPTRVDLSQPSNLPGERYLDIMQRGSLYYGVSQKHLDFLQNLPCLPRKLPNQYASFAVPEVASSPSLSQQPPLVVSPEELKQHDGSDGRSIWIAVNCKVIEVLPTAPPAVVAVATTTTTTTTTSAAATATTTTTEVTTTSTPSTSSTSLTVPLNSTNGSMTPSPSPSPPSMYDWIRRTWAGREVTLIMARMIYEPMFPIAESILDMPDEQRRWVEDMLATRLRVMPYKFVGVMDINAIHAKNQQWFRNGPTFTNLVKNISISNTTTTITTTINLNTTSSIASSSSATLTAATPTPTATPTPSPPAAAAAPFFFSASPHFSAAMSYAARRVNEIDTAGKLSFSSYIVEEPPSSSRSSTSRRSCWYVAIGSMMNPVSLSLRGINPIESHACFCPGYKLFFGRMGMADIVGEASSTFHGVLHRLWESDMQQLDKLESVYDRLPVQALLYDGRRQMASAYFMDEKKVSLLTKMTALPGERYIDILVRGALFHGVCQSYIDWLAFRVDCARRLSPHEYKTLLSDSETDKSVLPIMSMERDVAPFNADNIIHNHSTATTSSNGDECESMNGEVSSSSVDVKCGGTVVRFTVNGKVCEVSCKSSAASHMRAYAGSDATVFMARMLYEPMFDALSSTDSITRMSSEHRAYIEDQLTRVQLDGMSVVGVVDLNDVDDFLCKKQQRKQQNTSNNDKNNTPTTRPSPVAKI